MTYFDRLSGKGMIYISSINSSFPIYACNLPGKKTWYAETACMYVERGAELKVDVTGDRFQLFITNVQGEIKFDEEKWNSLDQSRLAFKCDENGNAINGLFA